MQPAYSVRPFNFNTEDDMGFSWTSLTAYNNYMNFKIPRRFGISTQPI